MARKLKVFRTTAGFNDAYVAAPSQKAALAAWGADVDLFARGIAEVVTDPALTAEPLANPGKVLTVSRGDLAAHLKALEKQSPPARRGGSAAVKMSPAKPAKPRKELKRAAPKRDRLDAAEKALKTPTSRCARRRPGSNASWTRRNALSCDFGRFGTGSLPPCGESAIRHGMPIKTL